jgi:hypothetical protein
MTNTITCTRCDESIRANAAGGWWHITIDGDEVGPYFRGKDDHEPWPESVLTASEFVTLRQLLDRLICEQEDWDTKESNSRADTLRSAYEAVQNIEEGRHDES